MIYRIAIYRYENGKRKFDHYATDEEMKYLRVNADGKVEKIESADSRSELPSPNLPCFETGEWFADDDYYSGSIYSQWIDVSSTHEVEWGFVLEGTKFFQNDILKVWLTKCDDEPELDEFYYAKIYYDPTYDCLMIHDTNLEYDYTFANYAIEWYNSSDSFDSLEVAGNIHENSELTRGKDE